MFKISLTHLHYTQYIFVSQSEGNVKINKEFVKRILFHGIEVYYHIQGISRVIMSKAELKMQPTIHFQS
jgi:hypothetical protein